MMRTILTSLLFLLLCGQATAQNLQPMRIRVNGVELHYVERGRGEPLILLHGASLLVFDKRITR